MVKKKTINSIQSLHNISYVLYLPWINLRVNLTYILNSFHLINNNILNEFQQLPSRKLMQSKGFLNIISNLVITASLNRTFLD